MNWVDKKNDTPREERFFYAFDKSAQDAKLRKKIANKKFNGGLRERMADRKKRSE